MKILYTQAALRKELEQVRQAGKTIGFVPTMGALHAGHCSLVKRCVAENDVCVVSVFVNPTQFNNAEDLAKYPRNIERDAALLEQQGATFVFAPTPEEMYSADEMSHTFQFDFGGLDQVMEGKYRPGHFNGVVQVVSKLFRLVEPQKAYFGEKDFQQLAIIRRMVRIMHFDVEIVGCPIVREASGLALSSRNERLSEAEKQCAVQISQILLRSRQLASTQSVGQVQKWVVDQLNGTDGLQAEYFEIVDGTTLQPTNDWHNAVGCATVYCGPVRLIDNIQYTQN